MNISFDASTDALTVASRFVTQIKDRVVVVTGVNPLGLGFSTAEAFASQGPRVLVLIGRNESKVQECISMLSARYPDVKYTYIHLDLSSLVGARETANSLRSNPDIPYVDILINNAGLSSSITSPRLSPDGVELHFAINHLGPFLFTNLILPKLITASHGKATGSTRVINLSSEGHMYSGVRFSDINFAKTHSSLPVSEQPAIEKIRALWPSAYTDPKEAYSPIAAYGQSKTANVLFSIGLTNPLYRKFGILSVAVHPGAVGTELTRDIDPALLKGMFEKWNGMGFGAPKTLSQGSATTLRCAVHPEIRAPELESGLGQYRGVCWSDCQLNDPSLWAVDASAAERLWAKSEELSGEKFEH